MTMDQEAYIRYRLQRARATLDEAKTLLDAGHLHGAVNRLYYACFYAVCALIFTEGKSSSKHSGVRAFFDEGWLKPHRVSAELGRFYRRVFKERQRADYEGPVHFTDTEVRGWFEEARAFVAEISQLAERQLAAGGPHA
jgi:hypothetical protein